MTFLEAASSGVVQGVTEFLPVSSSGHLVLLHALFGFQEPRLLFDLSLHLGTTAAVMASFWRHLLLLLTREKKFLFWVFLGSLPTAAIGLLFGKIFEQFFTQPQVVGFGFWVTAAFLWMGERLRPGVERELSGWSALLIGIGQGIAIIPGISRSGITIATGLLLGLRGKVAVQFSFFLMIPAVLGAFLYKALSSGGGLSAHWGGEAKELFLFGVGSLIAMGVGLWAIQMVLQTVEKRRLSFFSLYLLGMGLVTLFLFRGAS